MLKTNLKFKPELLKGKMVSQKINSEYLANVLGINITTFYRKLNHESEFDRQEMSIIRMVLNLNKNDMDSIFFAKELTETQEN